MDNITLRKGVYDAFGRGDMRIDGRDGASQRVNVTCVTPPGEEVASTL
jgi:hypothetical protein